MIISENLIIAATVSVIGLTSGIIGIGGYKVVEPVIEPKPRSMQLETLFFDGTKFTQRHNVTGTAMLPAKWMAQIRRGNSPICEGSGPGIYENKKETTLGINDWVGDRCPALKDGDIATAIWEYKTEKGFYKIIGGKIVIRLNKSKDTQNES